jgi:hypothetical protein
MFFIDWVSNSEILQQIKKIGKQMSETQEKIDALAAQLAKVKNEILAQVAALQAQIDDGAVVDLTALTAAVQGLDDLNPDEPDTGTDSAE